MAVMLGNHTWDNTNIEYASAVFLKNQLMTGLFPHFPVLLLGDRAGRYQNDEQRRDPEFCDYPLHWIAQFRGHKE